jgi:glycosyltransferase involved in cell wall biosynthesis
MHIAIDGMLLGHRSSGVEGTITDLVQTLAASGNHEYNLYTGASAATFAPAGGRLRIISSRCPVRFRPIRILWEQFALPSLLAADRCEILHAPGYVAPLMSPVPVVLTIHDMIAFSHGECCTRSNRWHYRLLVPPSIRKAAVVIVPSRAVRDDLVRLMPAAAGKIRVIPPGIREEFRPVRDAVSADRLRRKYGLAGPFILFLGLTEPKKNLVRLIEAYRLLRQGTHLQHQLVIAGAPSWDEHRIAKAVREYGLTSAVIRTGFVPADELPTLYSMADLFVFPSLCEGFGLPPLEAMACGTPVLVSDRGALPEIAGDAAGITDPLAADRMAHDMERVLTDQPLRDKRIADGLRHARTFSWAKSAAATEEAYVEAFNGRRIP